MGDLSRCHFSDLKHSSGYETLSENQLKLTIPSFSPSISSANAPSPCVFSSLFPFSLARLKLFPNSTNLSQEEKQHFWEFNKPETQAYAYLLKCFSASSSLNIMSVCVYARARPSVCCEQQFLRISIGYKNKVKTGETEGLSAICWKDTHHKLPLKYLISDWNQNRFGSQCLIFDGQELWVYNGVSCCF